MQGSKVEFGIKSFFLFLGLTFWVKDRTWKGPGIAFRRGTHAHVVPRNEATLSEVVTCDLAWIEALSLVAFWFFYSRAWS